MKDSPEKQNLIAAMAKYMELNGWYEFALVIQKAVKQVPECENNSIERSLLSALASDLHSVANDIKK